MNPNEKIKILIEALSYFKKFNNKIFVIKFGGNAMMNIGQVIEDIVLLKHVGIKPIVVHGGAPDIGKELNKIHIVPKFINGLRYTDSTIIKIVDKVFKKTNKEIVAGITNYGKKSISLEGIIKTKQKSHELGLVGEIIGINRQEIVKALKSDCIPVISPIGIGKDKKKYNMNADTAASHIAVALNAEKLTILTNVDGVIINGKILPHLDFETAKKEIKKGTINKGMIPKVTACIYAVKHECKKAHLINGLVPHSLLVEIFTDQGIGTEIVYRNGYNKNH